MLEQNIRLEPIAESSATTLRVSGHPKSELKTTDIQISVAPPGSGRQLEESLPVEIENVESPVTVHRNESSLAPVDTGFGAWSFLAAAFVADAVVWGFPNAFGVFLDAYLRDPSLTSQPRASTLLPLVGPLSTGLIYCSGPFLHPVTTRYPSHRRTVMWIGALCCFCSLLGASFATNLLALIILQGALYGIGGALLYHSCVCYMSEWFVNRRGLANGVFFAGTAAGGLVLPLFLPVLITKFGTSKTLRYLAIAELVLLIPIIPFIKPRLPESNIGFFATRGGRRGDRDRVSALRNWSWLNDSSIWFVLSANTLQGLAYFLPLVWLPTFASSLPHQDASSRSLSLALLNGFSLFGRISIGILSDKLNPFALAISTLTFTSLATFILWGLLAHSFKGVLAFGIVYGCFATGWSSVYTGFMKRFSHDDPTISTSIIGVLMLTRGIGNILSTPISTALQQPHSSVNSSSALNLNNNYHTGFEVSEGQYSRMIVYVGTCFAGSALITAFGWGWDNWKMRTRSERA
ncbi:Proton-linked Monocarboxylate Transporter [Abortiporus biennis]